MLTLRSILDVFGSLYGADFAHYSNGSQSCGWSCSCSCSSNITNVDNIQGNKQTISSSIHRRCFASNVITRWLGYKWGVNSWNARRVSTIPGRCTQSSIRSDLHCGKIHQKPSIICFLLHFPLLHALFPLFQGNDDENATLTAEPAVVVPAESDFVNDFFDEQEEQEHVGNDDHDGELGMDSESSSGSRHSNLPMERRMLPERRTLLQRGATMRRAARTISAMQQTSAARQRRNTSGSRSMVDDVLSTLEGIPTESAFDRSLPVFPSQASMRHVFQQQQERIEKLE